MAMSQPIPIPTPMPMPFAVINDKKKEKKILCWEQFFCDSRIKVKPIYHEGIIFVHPNLRWKTSPVNAFWNPDKYVNDVH